MGPKMNNIGKAFANPKIRGIFIILLIAIAIIFLVSFLRLKTAKPPGVASSATVARPPAIASIPGSAESSREYVKLQEMQNVQLAEEATKKQTAAIPTLTRTTYVDTGVSTEVSGCSVEELKRARSAGVAAAEIRCRGCGLAALKEVGFTAGELRNSGFNASELKAAGFDASGLKAAGFNASELATGGFSAKDLAQVGFDAAELNNAGFNARELQAVGFSAEALKAAGLAAKEATQNCNVADLLKTRTKGIKPDAIKNLKCSMSSLKAAGFAASELKAAGYGTKELKDGGFGAAELRAAGFASKDLKTAGFGVQALKDAGFNAQDLRNSGYDVGELKRAGFNADALKAAGFNAAELRDAGFNPQQLQQSGFNANDLKAAGFSDGDLVRAGLTSPTTTQTQGAANNCSVDRLRQDRANGVSIDDMRKRGCSATALKEAGFGIDDLTKAGIGARDLMKAGFSDQDLARAGFSTEAIAAAQQAEATAPTGAGAEAGGPTEGAAAAGQQGWQQQLATLRAQESQQMSTQEYQDKLKQVQQAMSSQANDLFAAWFPLPAQQFVAGEAAKNGEGTKAGESGGATGGGTGAAAAQNPNVKILKAGTILFAILDTGINSDERSPVMATVVDGDLKGARVLGDFRRVEKKVLLQFSILSIPNLPSSLTFNAVAIDPNTAKTALASRVDNHYMLRYGTVFASSFMSGVGQAVQNAGNSVQINTSTGENVNFNASTNFGKASLQGLGEVGNKFSEVLTPLTNTPPTVEVKAGSGIGILLMSDLSIPKS